MSPEAVLALGYALFLVATATALDLLARHANRRSHRFRTAGFTYHEHLDVWECPEASTCGESKTITSSTWSAIAERLASATRAG